VVDGLPSGDTGVMVPVVLATNGVGIVPNAVPCIIVVDGIIVVAAAGVEGVVPIAPPVADMAITGTDGVPGAICPVGVAQVTTVPGVVGSEASGTGASVVSGEFG
jgi:hypothetical protein